MWATDQRLEPHFDQDELDRVYHYMAVYANYVKLRSLKIAIRAVDLDQVTTDILFLFQRKIDDLEEKKRQAKEKKRKGGR